MKQIWITLAIIFAVEVAATAWFMRSCKTSTQPKVEKTTARNTPAAGS